MISVIMRSYNRPKTLKEAAGSILHQSEKNWELIIVDDGSTDPGVEQVLVGLEKDPRIKVIRNEENVDGHSIRLNQGIEAARGTYIGFCDDDDRRIGCWMRTIIRGLDDRTDCEYAVCQSHALNEGGSLTLRDAEPPKKLDDLLEKNKVDLGEMVIRRTLFDRMGVFDERLRYGDDWEYVSRLVKAEVPYHYIPQALCIHQMHAGGQLNTRTEQQRQLTQHIIRTKKWTSTIRVAVYWPDPGRLQYTQFEVVKGVRDALLRIPTTSVVAKGVTSTAQPNPKTCDLIFVVCPFQCEDTELAALRAKGIPMVSIHTEDPPALNSNLQKSKFFDWVITNDVSTIPIYHEKAATGEVPYTPEQVGYMPCLSVNTATVGDTIRHKVQPKWDMMICGYMYPSRQAWFESVKDKIDWKLLLIGRGWEAYANQFEVMGDQDPLTTMVLYSDTKILACVHRQTTDDGTVVAFRSTSRGFREAYSGALVLIDNTRQVCPPFMEDEVRIFDYSNPEDFIKQAHWVLSHSQEASRMGEKAQARARNEFTYRARMTRLIRDIRSPKFHIRVP